MIDPAFFDREIYAIYRAIWERWGDESWHVVWRAGEILFDDLQKEIDFTDDEPITVMLKLGDYLQAAGYVEEIFVKELAEDELEYAMSAPAIGPGAQRIIAEGGVPAHISTALMFAALEALFGLRIEMIGEPRFLEGGLAVERWRLTPMGGEG